MKKNVYISTPLYYVNAEPHLGSTYTNVVTDAWARFHRQRNRDTFFQTGTDEHGEKIVEAAEAAGRSPKEFVDEVSAKFRSVWDSCGIGYDHFIRTSDPAHIAYVQEILSQIHEQGDMRDMYMPNPACDNYEMFEFVGRLMAGRRRGVKGRRLARPDDEPSRRTHTPVARSPVRAPLAL